MVPPQFTAYAASWDPSRSAGCIGPYPSSPTCVSAKPLRKEFHTPILTVSHRPAALWQDHLVCTGFLHRVEYAFPIVYHRLRHKSTKTVHFCHIFSAHCVQMSPLQGNGTVYQPPQQTYHTTKETSLSTVFRMIFIFLYFASNTFVFLVKYTILQNPQKSVMM